MKRNFLSLVVMVAGFSLLPVGAIAGDTGSPINPCIGCHDTDTPSIVKQWQASKHSKVGVKCYVCHMAQEDDPAGSEHNGFQVTTAVKLNSCEGCHPEQIKEFKKDWDNVLRLIHGKKE